jgi:hypothetical protein
MRVFHHGPLCMPIVPPFLVQLDGPITAFHSACLAQDQASLLGDLCCPCPFSVPQGSFSDRSGIFGTFLVCIGLHPRLQGHLR